MPQVVQQLRRLSCPETRPVQLLGGEKAEEVAQVVRVRALRVRAHVPIGQELQKPIDRCDGRAPPDQQIGFTAVRVVSPNYSQPVVVAPRHSVQITA